MAVKMRFKRLGRTHQAFFRLAVMDSRNPRDGRTLEELGTYDPTNKKVEEQVKLKTDRIRYWLSVGAQPSDTVRNMLKRHDVIDGHGALKSESEAAPETA